MVHTEFVFLSLPLSDKYYHLMQDDRTILKFLLLVQVPFSVSSMWKGRQAHLALSPSFSHRCSQPPLSISQGWTEKRFNEKTLKIIGGDGKHLYSANSEEAISNYSTF